VMYVVKIDGGPRGGRGVVVCISVAEVCKEVQRLMAVNPKLKLTIEQVR
jgi:hypothetical protein